MADVMSDDSTELPAALELEQEPKEVKSQIVTPHVDVEAVEPAKEMSGEWIEGVVAMWKKTHGFINYGEDNKERVFVHKTSVVTDDKKVLLRRGMECRFKLAEGEDDRIHAVEVSARDGSPLAFHQKHGEQDSYDREIQFDGEVFKGAVKFFSRFRAYGRIRVSAEALERLLELGVEEKDCSDLYFKENDLNIIAYPAKINRADEVSFQIFNSTRGWGAMNIKTADGDLIPQFTEEERAEKRAQKEQEAANEAQEEEKPKTKKKRTRKNKEKAAEVEVVDITQFKEIDTEARFEGTVTSYNVHRFGFIVPSNIEELKEFGIIKNERLSFRAFDIETDHRPAMIDVDTKVKFSIELQEKSGVLYANNIRSDSEGKIVAEREYKAPEPRELENAEEWVEGTVFFFNWRRGHGRVEIEGETEKFYFHRDDLRSNDKVPGIEDGTKVICQRAVDSKGPSVTNIMNVDKTLLENHLPKYFKTQD